MKAALSLVLLCACAAPKPLSPLETPRQLHVDVASAANKPMQDIVDLDLEKELAPSEVYNGCMIICPDKAPSILRTMPQDECVDPPGNPECTRNAIWKSDKSR